MRGNMKQLCNSLCYLLIIMCSVVYGQEEAKIVSSKQYNTFVEKVGSWVDTKGILEVPKDVQYEGQETFYLLVDNQVNTTTDSTKFYRKRIYKILTNKGVEHNSTLSIDFNPLYQKCYIHTMNIIRGNDTISKVDVNNIKLLQKETDLDKLMYNGLVTASVLLSDVRIGDIIEYSYTLVGDNPVFGNKYSDQFTMGWSVAVLETRLRILTKKKLYYKLFNMEQKPNIKRRKGIRTYSWSVSGLKPFVYESESPSWHRDYPYVQVTEFKKWKDVVQWALPLYQKNTPLGDTLGKLVKVWDKSSKNDVDFFQKALSFVQDEIRYFGVELGENTHKPTDPNIVVKQRFGDCKDKALLLCTLLEKRGIEAWPALVSSSREHTISDYLPSPYVFNHVICKVIIGEKIFWVDGTVNYQTGKPIYRSIYNYGKSLVLKPKNNDLENMELPKEYISSTKVYEQFTVTDYEKPVTLKVKSVYRGADAEYKRSYCLNTPKSKIMNDFVSYYSKLFKNAKAIGDIRYENIDSTNTFITYEEYELEGYVKHSKGKVNFDLSDGTVTSYVVKPKIQKRTSPYLNFNSKDVLHEVTVFFPTTPDFGDTTVYTKTIEDDYIYFNVNDNVDKDKKTLRVQYHVKTKVPIIPAKAIPDHVKQLEEIKDNLEYSAWLTYIPKGKVESLIKSLITSLDKAY